jgi:hypothetical protein
MTIVCVATHLFIRWPCIVRMKRIDGEAVCICTDSLLWSFEVFGEFFAYQCLCYVIY